MREQSINAAPNDPNLASVVALLARLFWHSGNGLLPTPRFLAEVLPGLLAKNAKSPNDHKGGWGRVHRIPSRVRDDREAPLLSGKDGASW